MIATDSGYTDIVKLLGDVGSKSILAKIKMIK